MGEEDEKGRIDQKSIEQKRKRREGEEKEEEYEDGKMGRKRNGREEIDRRIP